MSPEQISGNHPNRHLACNLASHTPLFTSCACADCRQKKRAMAGTLLDVMAYATLCPISRSADWGSPLAGAQTSVADKKGRTALHLAVGCSSRMVEKLLLLSVSIDAADIEGRTALHYAAQKGAKWSSSSYYQLLCAFGFSAS